MSEKIRIVSDLHIGHKASVLKGIADAKSLAEGVDRLIFNGDTLELKYGDLDTSKYDAEKQKKVFDEEVRTWGVKVDLITGNHDPSISDLHHLSLCNNQVFVTHGDGLFQEIAPWSSNVKALRACGKDIDPKQTGKTPKELHEYLVKFKETSIEAHKLEDGYNPTSWGKAKILIHQAWPPTTPFKILKCWKETPDRAASLADRFSLSPRFIIIGHTHNPNIAVRADKTIINLGSYFPWPGAQCVDIEGGKLTVRKVVKRKNNLKIGQTVASFTL